MCGVLWDQISPEKLEEIPIFKIQSRRANQWFETLNQLWAKKTLI